MGSRKRTVDVRWDSEANRFVAEGTHLDQRIHVNAPHDGPPTGFSAAELLLAGIGACSAWDVVEILRKGRHDVHSVEVSVTGEQSDRPPSAYSHIDVEYTVRGEKLPRPAVERAVDLSFDRYCSAIATVRGVATVTPHVTVVEEPSPTTSVAG